VPKRRRVYLERVETTQEQKRQNVYLERGEKKTLSFPSSILGTSKPVPPEERFPGGIAGRDRPQGEPPWPLDDDDDEEELAPEEQAGQEQAGQEAAEEQAAEKAGQEPEPAPKEAPAEAEGQEATALEQILQLLPRLTRAERRRLRRELDKGGA
jgi:hypothetical protein